ncbi:MAG: zinc-ribbon domain-containing protein [Nitrososphaerota archaeon]|nr:zinc-ribbon domain-containing protein [Nitrososphaerota archaeon]
MLTCYKANFCPNCGATVPIDATFCSHCGKQT